MLLGVSWWASILEEHGVRRNPNVLCALNIKSQSQNCSVFFIKNNEEKYYIGFAL